MIEAGFLHRSFTWVGLILQVGSFGGSAMLDMLGLVLGGGGIALMAAYLTLCERI
jgi:hypothetical protein